MRLSVTVLLTGVFASLLVVIGILGWTALDGSARQAEATTELADKWLPSIRAIGAIDSDAANLRIAHSREVLISDPESLQENQKIIDQRTDRVHKDLEAYAALISSEKERTIYSAFETNWDRYLALSDRMIGLMRNGQKDGAQDLFLGEMRDIFNGLREDLDTLIEINNAGAELARENSDQAASTTRTTTITALAIAVVATLGAMVFTLFQVSRPVRTLTLAMQAVSGGNLGAEIPFASRQNEIGDMARCLATFRDSLKQTERLRAEQAEAEKRQAADMVAARHRIADEFEAKMGSLAERFVGASAELARSARSLSATAEETSRQSQAVAGASEEASANVQTVAVGTEELSASIREIASQVERSSTIARSAAEDGAVATRNVETLSSAAQQIGEVVELISTIAAQTNLLALNATIEAARAGDAGRGFAVVASEVKQLAEQTSRATEQIGRKISEIQSATSVSVETITRMVGTINTIREVTGSIASAVEQQSAATGEIAENTHRAAIGAADVNQTIAGVGTAAEMTGAASTQLMSLSSDLSVRSSELKTEVQTLVSGLRAA